MIIGYYLLQLTWGLPQNILGGILWVYLRYTHRGTIWEGEIHCPVHGRYRCAVVTRWDMAASMGLGCFVFLGTADAADPSQILVHEYGHTIQSLILGPMFLPLIGLPSLLWSRMPQLRRYRKEHQLSYYEFYPERWANRLGEKITGGQAPKQ